MSFGPLMVNGLPVQKSSHLSEFTQASVKLLAHKRWHKESRSGYAKRVQKKWNKKHGFKMVPYFIKTNAGIFAHPNTVDRMMDVLALKEAGGRCGFLGFN